MDNDPVVQAFVFLDERRKDAEAGGGVIAISAEELSWLWQAFAEAYQPDDHGETTDE